MVGFSLKNPQKPLIMCFIKGFLAKKTPLRGVFFAKNPKNIGLFDQGIRLSKFAIYKSRILTRNLRFWPFLAQKAPKRARFIYIWHNMAFWQANFLWKLPFFGFLGPFLGPTAVHGGPSGGPCSDAEKNATKIRGRIALFFDPFFWLKHGKNPGKTGVFIYCFDNLAFFGVFFLLKKTWKNTFLKKRVFFALFLFFGVFLVFDEKGFFWRPHVALLALLGPQKGLKITLWF